ncbi:hypothetical protein D3C87_1908150 [compost metagenome]
MAGIFGTPPQRFNPQPTMKALTSVKAVMKISSGQWTATSIRIDGVRLRAMNTPANPCAKV